LSATISCVALSELVHITLEPTEMLIGFGVNPPLTILAFTVVDGDMGELAFPQAIAASKIRTANVILIRMGMAALLSERDRANTRPFEMQRSRGTTAAARVTAGLREIRSERAARKSSVSGHGREDRDLSVSHA
jgi:hypothetical protein